MKAPTIFLIACAAILCGAACTKRIDTTTDESAQKSIKAVRDSLSAAEREKFDEALKVVAMSEVNFKTLLSGDAPTNMKRSLDGKTAGEVIAAAEALQREREERERKEALAEIAELEKQKDDAEKAKVELAKFVVTRARFYKEKQTYGRPEPVIELSMRNETKIPVSRAYFTGTLGSKGRAVPWLKEDFNYSISGGMEPGEWKQVRLAPNMFGDWGRVDAPEDAVLTVIVKRLDGADGKAAFDADFDEADEKRLAALQKTFGTGK